MSQVTWDLIKNTKRFYVRTYRKASTALFISAFFNVLLGVGIFYIYFNKPDHDFYATSGVAPPIELTPMDAPNYSSTYLLASDAGENYDPKVIPQ
jgi:hypothetical protein